MRELHSLRGLSWRLGIPLPVLLSFAEDCERLYDPFDKPRPNKSPRRIDNPRADLKDVQRAVRRELSIHPLDESVRACVKGGSPRKHAEFVAHQKNVAETDLKNCFTKITNRMVFRRLRQLGYGPKTASLLTRLVTFMGHVPQGAPSSDVIANQVLTPLDKIANEIAAARGLRYSRCMDGFVVAGTDDTREALGLIINAIVGAGLAVRRSKTRNASRRRAQDVAGLTVNGKTGPKVQRSKRQEIRTAVHRMVAARRRGEEVHESFPRVRGCLIYLKPTNPGLVARLVRQITAAGIPWNG